MKEGDIDNLNYTDSNSNDHELVQRPTYDDKKHMLHIKKGTIQQIYTIVLCTTKHHIGNYDVIIFY